MGRSNQRGSKTSQACHGHLRCNVNLVRFFPLHFTLPVFGRLFLFRSLTHAAINLQPPSHTVPNPGVKCRGALAPRDTKRPQSVHYLSFPPSPRFPTFSSSPDIALLGNLWSSIMRSSAPDDNNLLARTVCFDFLTSDFLLEGVFVGENAVVR